MHPGEVRWVTGEGIGNMAEGRGVCTPWPSAAFRRMIVVENANHVFKHEPRTLHDVSQMMSLVLQYTAADVPLAEGFIDEIVNFLDALEGGSEAP